MKVFVFHWFLLFVENKTVEQSVNRDFRIYFTQNFVSCFNMFSFYFSHL